MSPEILNTLSCRSSLAQFDFHKIATGDGHQIGVPFALGKNSLKI